MGDLMTDQTKYFVTSEGNYIGGFLGDAAMETVPEGSIEVPSAPICFCSSWVADHWVDYEVEHLLGTHRLL